MSTITGMLTLTHDLHCSNIQGVLSDDVDTHLVNIHEQTGTYILHADIYVIQLSSAIKTNSNFFQSHKKCRLKELKYK